MILQIFAICSLLLAVESLCVPDGSESSQDCVENPLKKLEISKWEAKEDIEIFREYLRIPSAHPNISYDECVKFLSFQATRLALPFQIFYPGSKTRPIIVMTWTGTEPDLPSIVLNSHMDVVPVEEEHWTHPPFGAEIDSAGRIYGRGSQDAKQIGIQYLAAIDALKRQEVRLKRTVHIVFVPDEEVGSALGMAAFVRSDDFKSLNIGFALDEGRTSEDESFLVFYTQRTICHLQFTCVGTSGHGSTPLNNTAAEKVQFILNKMLALRAKLIGENANMTLGNMTTINLTKIHGGTQSNVVPAEIKLSFDCRLPPNVDRHSFIRQLRQWSREAGDVKLDIDGCGAPAPATPVDETNPYWVAFRNVLVDELKLKIQPQIAPGGSDSFYMREAGVLALEFSPTNNTPNRMHGHDEFLGVETFLRGIEIYKKLIPKLANF